MRSLFTLMLLLMIQMTFSQSRDTIFLKEVAINHKKEKTVFVKTARSAGSLGGAHLQQVVSLIQNVPAGTIRSISFHVNPSSIYENEWARNRKDVEMALLIYDVDQNGFPRNELTSKQIQFTVKGDKQGIIELDLTPLGLNSEPSLFFGVAILDPSPENDFCLKIGMSKTGDSYFKTLDSQQWSRFSKVNQRVLQLYMVLGVTPEID